MIKINVSGFRRVSSEHLYYLAFGLYIFFFGVSHTMFSYGNNFVNILKYIKILCTLLVFAKIAVCGKVRTKWLILVLITFTVLSMVFISMDSTVPIFLMILFFGAQKTDYIILTKIYLFCTSIVYSTALIASQIGIIEDRILKRYNGGESVLRHSLGTKYVTVFAAVYFFIIASYLFLSKNKLTWNHYILISVMTIMMYLYTDARLETLAIFLLLFCILFFNKLYHLHIVRFVMKNCI